MKQFRDVEDDIEPNKVYVDLKVKLRKSLEELHEQEDMIVNIQIGLQQKLGLEPDYNNNLL